MDLLALTSQGLTRIKPEGLVAVGGSSATGLKVPGLKHRDDYAVVGPAEGGFLVHALRGKKSGRQELRLNQVLAIDDLLLCALDAADTVNPTQTFSGGMQALLTHFSAAEDLGPALSWFLRHLIDLAGMEKGLLITRGGEGNFQSLVKEGVKDGDPWLSEALVQETLSSGRPQWIQNRFGSQFDGSKSLVAAGFLSVFSLPLVARGEVLGTVIVGSTMPHSGLGEEQKDHIQTLARLLALLFWFHRRDLQSQAEIRRLSDRRESPEDCPVQTVAPRLQRELAMAERLAATNLSVLIRGETGVGKEVVARWLHERSERRKGPFVALNCAAIPAELLESILFGHKRGAFTGAVSDQTGKFVQAHNGTLLLDEIGDLPERLQAKLLRVLQEGTVDPLGSARPVKVDVRVLAATHRDLPELVRKGEFRQDLFYRIAETQVELPPLRERPEDIALLAVRFLAQAAPGKRISPSALDWLSGLPWPGNVRELSSAVRRAAALATHDELTKGDFLTGVPSTPEKSRDWLGGGTLEEAKQAFVREKIQLALHRTHGNRQKAADLLGVTVRTLFRHLEDDATFTKRDRDVMPRPKGENETPGRLLT